MSTGPVQGMRDFLPVEVRRRHFLAERFRGVYERYGYDPIDTPALERLEVLLGSGGQDNEKLIFKVMRRGEALDRALASGGSEALAEEGLRFDLTVPLARYFAEHRAKLPKVFRRYHMGPVWRAERPARGRYREFWQCDVDVVGAAAPLGEIDVILATTDALAAVGFDGFSVRLNHRRLLAALLGALGVDKDLHASAVVAIDKLDKIGTDGVARELRERGIADEAVTRFERLDLAAARDVPAREGIEVLARMLVGLASEGGSIDAAEVESALGEMRQLVGALSAVRGDRLALALDPILARGMGYYTGAIFEVAAEGVPFALGGGGRYDGLIGRFQGQSVPAVGFSIGFERVLVVMSERAMFPQSLGALDVYVTVFAPDMLDDALRMADGLRTLGLRVVVPVDRGSLKHQLREANERGARFALVVGPNERDAGAVQIKTMASGQSVTVPRDEVGPRLVAEPDEGAEGAPPAVSE